MLKFREITNTKIFWKTKCENFAKKIREKVFFAQLIVAATKLSHRLRIFFVLSIFAFFRESFRSLESLVPG